MKKTCQCPDCDNVATRTRTVNLPQGKVRFRVCQLCAQFMDEMRKGLWS